jgi:hypothetical protein
MGIITMRLPISGARLLSAWCLMSLTLQVK